MKKTLIGLSLVSVFFTVLFVSLHSREQSSFKTPSIPIATPTSVPLTIPDVKPVIRTKEACALLSQTEAKKCYMDLAIQTGNQSYCWKTEIYSQCYNAIVLARHQPELCDSLYPESASACRKHYLASTTSTVVK
jgi:hypothetical protein